VPVLGFFDQYFYRYSFVADHFQYLASVGVIALACAAGQAPTPLPYRGICPNMATGGKAYVQRANTRSQFHSVQRDRTAQGAAAADAVLRHGAGGLGIALDAADDSGRTGRSSAAAADHG